jgi:hypothetical protein
MRKPVTIGQTSKIKTSRGAQTDGERPSRSDAEAAVRTLIRWAGDNPKRPGMLALLTFGNNDLDGHDLLLAPRALDGLSSSSM